MNRSLGVALIVIIVLGVVANAWGWPSGRRLVADIGFGSLQPAFPLPELPRLV
jgi:hypothetical protein